MTLTATTGSTGEAGFLTASSAFLQMTVALSLLVALKVAEFITVEAASGMRMLDIYKPVPKFDSHRSGNGQHNGNGKHADPLEKLFRDGLIYCDAEVDAMVLDLLRGGPSTLRVLRVHTMDSVHPAVLLKSLSRLELYGHITRDGTRYSMVRP